MGGDFCCAVGCHNDRGANQDVTFHVFPRDLQRRARWIAAVRRAHWVPTKTSRLCSVHFTDESYELSSRLSKEFGLGQRSPRLKPDAVPTIFNYVVAPPAPLRGAFAKRRRKDVSQILVSKCVRFFKKSRRVFYDAHQLRLLPFCSLLRPRGADLYARERSLCSHYW